MNFTLNNHLKYYIDGQQFANRTSMIQNYSVEVGAVDPTFYATTNFQNEQRRIADHIYNSFGVKNEFAMFVSGGTDSEIALRTFIGMGIHPRCFTIRFKNDYNMHDVVVARNIAKELSVHLNEIEFDIKDFFFSGAAADLSRRVQCSQITYLMVYEVIRQINLPSIMAGEVFLKREVSSSGFKWMYMFRENEDSSAIKFSLQSGIPLVNEWFSYTPEVLLLYLEHPTIKALVNTPNNFKLSSVSTKNKVLTELIPNIHLRVKTHGFEKLVGFNTEVNQILSREIIPNATGIPDGVEMNDLLAMLRKDFK